MQERLLSYDVDRLHRDVSFFCGEPLRKEGLSVGLMYFILYVCKHPDCTPGQIAKDLALDRAYVLRAVNKLAEKGFLHRSEHPTDGRATVLAATARGQEIFALGRQLLHRWDEEMLSCMTEQEKEQLFALLDKLQRKGR